MIEIRRNFLSLFFVGLLFFTQSISATMSIAVLAPQAVGLTQEQEYLLEVVRREIEENFVVSGISIMDWQSFEQILATASSDDERQSMISDMGMTHTVRGTITRTATGYTLTTRVSRNSDGVLVASQTETFTFAELDNRT